VRVTADPSVREASVEGEHTARRDGDTLVIETESLGGERGFAFASSRRKVRHGFGDPVDIVFAKNRSVRQVHIRMNPNLPLDAEVDAGSLTVEGVRGPIKARAAAGSLRIVGFAAPIDLTAAAGSISAEGRLDSGESHIQCDAGKVALRLERGSSVDIDTTVNLGKVSFLHAREPVQSRGRNRGPSSSTSYTVGSGDGSLDITVNLGAVTVDIDE
jgi:hypothetical protein